MEKHYDQREALHAVKQESELPAWQPVTKWVIRPCSSSRNQWETVECVELVNANGEWWDMKKGTSYFGVDVFDSELAARNELEKRLYALSESLRKHRAEMSRMLVNCPEGRGVL
jgi:hypothetical protein